MAGGRVIYAEARSCNQCGRALDSLGGGTLYPALHYSTTLGGSSASPK